MFESLTSLVVATTLLLGSPGPVPLALAASGAVFGFRAGIPFLIGILTGLAVAISLGAAGLAVLFETIPASRIAFQVCGGLYICYVAFKIATAPTLSNQQSTNTSAPTFRDGFVLNILNPKAYAAFAALFSQFLLPFSSKLASAAGTAFMVFSIAVAIDMAWLALGGLLRPVFESPRFARPTRVIFAALMIVAVVSVFLRG